MKKQKLVYFMLLIITLLVIISPWLGREYYIIESDIHPEADIRSGGYEILLGLLGEFRYMLASFWWLKSDQYWHEVPGSWTEDTEIMPIMRIVTLLDHSFTQAYSFGGYHLAINLDRPREGIEFLQEGLSYNRDDYDLNWTTAFVYWKKFKDYNKAVHYGKMAFDAAKEKTQKLNALRLVASSYEQLGDYQNAVNTWQKFLEIFPDNEIVIEKIKNDSQKIKDLENE